LLVSLITPLAKKKYNKQNIGHTQTHLQIYYVQNEHS